VNLGFALFIMLVLMSGNKYEPQLFFKENNLLLSKHKVFPPFTKHVGEQIIMIYLLDSVVHRIWCIKTLQITFLYCSFSISVKSVQMEGPILIFELQVYEIGRNCCQILPPKTLKFNLLAYLASVSKFLAILGQ